MKVGDRIRVSRTIRGRGKTFLHTKGERGTIIHLPNPRRSDGVYVKLDSGEKNFIRRRNFGIIIEEEEK